MGLWWGDASATTKKLFDFLLLKLNISGLGETSDNFSLRKKQPSTKTI